MFSSVQVSRSVVSDSLRPMDCSTAGFPVHHQLWSLFKLMSIESVMPSNHLILYCPLLLLLPIVPSIRIFPNESVLCVCWLGGSDRAPGQGQTCAACVWTWFRWFPWPRMPPSPRPPHLMSLFLFIFKSSTHLSRRTLNIASFPLTLL